MTAGAVSFEALWSLGRSTSSTPPSSTPLYTRPPDICDILFVFRPVPLVYPGIYGFKLGQTGLMFLSIIVGLVGYAAFYFTFYYFVSEPQICRLGLGVLE
jgi:hypothetical protein